MNSIGGSWSAPEPVPGGRASDADRDAVVARLSEAAGQGIIDLSELEDRLGATYAAKSRKDLELITIDLPHPADEAVPVRSAGMFRNAMRNAAFRMHATVYGATNSMFVGIWAVSGGGDFWPFYPAAGWGIGLCAHAAAASAVTVHRDARRQRARRNQDDRRDRHAERLARRGQQLASRAERKGLPPQAAADVQRAIAQAQRAYAQARKTLHERLPETLPIPPAVQEMLGADGAVAASGAPAPPRVPTPAADPSPPVPPVPPVAPSSSGTSTPTANGAGPDLSHRYVVALFVDVVGSTQLNEVMGDEGWVRIRNRLRDVLATCFEEHGGWEANTAGDGVLARFDQPDGAVRAAIEVLRRLDRQRTETGFAPSVRIGVHSGDAVEDGQDIIGTVVNLASRVTSAAEPDEILVTEHVADHLGPNVTTEGRGLHTLKGVGRPRHLLAVQWR